MARLKGIKTVNIVRRGGLEAPLLALGADAVVVYEGARGEGQAESFAAAAAAVCEATGGAPIQLACNAVCGLSGELLAKCLSSGGAGARHSSHPQFDLVWTDLFVPSLISLPPLSPSLFPSSPSPFSLSLVCECIGAARRMRWRVRRHNPHLRRHVTRAHVGGGWAAALQKPRTSRARNLNLKVTGLTHNFPVDPAV